MLDEEIARRKHQGEDICWVQGILSAALFKRSFGRITINIEDGIIKRVIEEKSLEPPHKRKK